MSSTLNPYNEEHCRSIVEERYLSAIRVKFGTSALLFYDRILPKLIHSHEGLIETYKSKGTIPAPRTLNSVSIYSCVVYYYISQLDTIGTVADVGCGDNLLKGIVPNIYGIDPYGSFCDETDEFDSNGNFTKKHYQEFDSAIAINSIHYVSLVDLVNQVYRFADIIKPGGRGFVTLNVARLVENTGEEDLLKLFGTINPDQTQLSVFIDQVISNISLNFLVIENLVTECYDEWMDGNIRLVFEV